MRKLAAIAALVVALAAAGANASGGHSFSDGHHGPHGGGISISDGH